MRLLCCFRGGQRVRHANSSEALAVENVMTVEAHEYVAGKQPRSTGEAWKRKAIFNTIVTGGNTPSSGPSSLGVLMIDGGSMLNFVAKDFVEKLQLPTRPAPEPCTVTWLHNQYQVPVTETCEVVLSFNSFVDRVECHVWPMTEHDIVLGRPWIFDRGVVHSGRENTYAFEHDGKQIVLFPMRPEKVQHRVARE